MNVNIMKSIFKVTVLLALACASNVLFGSMKQGNTRVINVGKWLKCLFFAF